MAEYIDREAALKAIAEDKIEMTPELIAIGRAIGTYTAEQAFDGINQACDRHIESIKIIPAADVQPVKHGKWIPRILPLNKAGNECSACLAISVGAMKPYYCPNCGADMRGE